MVWSCCKRMRFKWVTFPQHPASWCIWSILTASSPQQVFCLIQLVMGIFDWFINHILCDWFCKSHAHFVVGSASHVRKHLDWFTQLQPFWLVVPAVDMTTKQLPFWLVQPEPEKPHTVDNTQEDEGASAQPPLEDDANTSPPEPVSIAPPSNSLPCRSEGRGSDSVRKRVSKDYSWISKDGVSHIFYAYRQLG